MTTEPEENCSLGLTAIVLAWKKMPVMVCVLAAIFADFLLYIFVL